VNPTMTTIGKPERATQDRVLDLFCGELGYAALGNWSERPGNSNLEEGLLAANLSHRGYSPEAISARNRNRGQESGSVGVR
jgi:type I restriction enzyme R subunit